jgi:hypothetical protein
VAAHNPYAPSKASLTSGEPAVAGGGVWRNDDELIVAHGAAFPQRCVKCNEPSETPHKYRKVYWHHPAVYVLLLGYAILYIIVALIVRRAAEVNPGLCAEHRRKRLRWIAIGWGGVLFGWVIVLGVGKLLGLEGGTFALLAVLVFLGSAIAGVVGSRILYPKRIDERYARLKGADPRFLDSLPNHLPY